MNKIELKQATLDDVFAQNEAILAKLTELIDSVQEAGNQIMDVVQKTPIGKMLGALVKSQGNGAG